MTKMRKEPIHIISLGAGVQSSTMALMAAHGELTPMPTAAIFADTHAEPPSVYRWLDWLEKQLPFPVYRVSRGSLTDACLRVNVNKKTGQPYYQNMIPAFMLAHDGGVGRVQRHCTYNYKIIPITKKQRELAGIKRWTKKDVGPAVIQWIGISMDESKRCAPSGLPWCESRWPLIENRMRRYDCGSWMMKHGYPQPPRSACVYCPFHRNEEWRRLKNEEPEAFVEAVEFEAKLQNLHKTITANGKINGTPFLHRSCKPLGEIDFRNESDMGQGCLWPEEVCGVCGV